MTVGGVAPNLFMKKQEQMVVKFSCSPGNQKKQATEIKGQHILEPLAKAIL